MEIAQRSAGIKQVTDFGSDDFDVYVICVSTHKLEERWWTKSSIYVFINIQLTKC